MKEVTSNIDNKDDPSGTQKHRAMVYVLWPLKHPLIIVVFVTLFFCFYMPADERQFLNSIQQGLQQSSDGVVYLRDITDFEWDTACYLSSLTSLKDISPYIPDDILAKENGFSKYWPFFLGSYWFLSKGELVKQFSYNSGAFQLTPNGIRSRGLLIDGEWYTFFSEASFEGSFCGTSATAAFKTRKSSGTQEGSRLIVFTTTKKTQQ